MLKIALQVALVLSFGIAAWAQEADAPAVKTSVTEIYLAKDDGSGKAGEQAAGFITTDVPIYCVVLLDSATPVKVTMNLVAVSVPGVKGNTRVVSTTYLTRDNQNRVNFTGRPAGQWVAGRYRVEILVGDEQAATREFAIQSATQARPVSRPAGAKSGDKSRFAGRVKKP